MRRSDRFVCIGPLEMLTKKTLICFPTDHHTWIQSQIRYFDFYISDDLNQVKWLFSGTFLIFEVYFHLNLDLVKIAHYLACYYAGAAG